MIIILRIKMTHLMKKITQKDGMVSLQKILRQIIYIKVFQQKTRRVNKYKTLRCRRKSQKR